MDRLNIEKTEPDWDDWDYIEHEFQEWLDKEENNRYKVYNGSNAMIAFLRKNYFSPEKKIINH